LVTTQFSRAGFRDTPAGRCALKTCYAIIKTRRSYGSETSISLVLDDTGLTHLSFSSPEEARAWIRRIAGRKDYFGRNESAPPAYAVTKVGSERFCDAYKRTFGSGTALRGLR
jgi:hypothetical protein